MKKNRLKLSILTTFLLALSLVGCGGTSSSQKSDFYESQAVTDTASPQNNTADMPAPDSVPTDLSDLSQISAQAPLDERKIIKHVEMTLETKEFNKALDQITQMVKDAGGYIESMSTDGPSLESSSSYERSARIAARIPSADLSRTQKDLNALYNVTTQSETMEDISDSYFDAQAHLKTLTLQEERLLDILSKAEKLEDVITLEQALSQVRYEIESITATLKRMDSQGTYSYLNLYLQEVGVYNELVSSPQNFGERLIYSSQVGWRNFISGSESFILFVVESLPIILMLVLLIFLFIFVIRTLEKRHRARMEFFGKQQPTRSQPVNWQPQQPTDTKSNQNPPSI